MYIILYTEHCVYAYLHKSLTFHTLSEEKTLLHYDQ